MSAIPPDAPGASVCECGRAAKTKGLCTTCYSAHRRWVLSGHVGGRRLPWELTQAEVYARGLSSHFVLDGANDLGQSMVLVCRYCPVQTGPYFDVDAAIRAARAHGDYYHQQDAGST